MNPALERVARQPLHVRVTGRHRPRWDPGLVAAVALIVAAAVIVFFGAGYAVGRLFLAPH